MTVKWTKIEETSQTGYMPTSTSNSWSLGVNSGGGTVEFLQLRYDLTFADSPVVNGEVASLISSLRIVSNGSVVHDFSAGYADAGTAGPSQYGYLINHIGGRVVEEPTSTPATRTGYINIPLGLVLPNGVNRWEIVVDWAASSQAIDSGSMSWWIRYNDNAQTSTMVVPATSFLSTSGAYEQVVVRVPQNVPAGAAVTALCVLNDSEADEYGSQGIRINALSDFGIPITMYRAQNGDMSNGIMWNKGSTSADETQTFSTRLSGAILIQTLGLTGGDVICSVDSSAATTRRFLPILTWPIGGKAHDGVKQSQPVVGNTRKATLEGSLQ
tara:strand:- start:3583 stop:4563 length:981 start_codon:yes stop_codon:yes gene_type:complete